MSAKIITKLKNIFDIKRNKIRTYRLMLILNDGILNYFINTFAKYIFQQGKYNYDRYNAVHTNEGIRYLKSRGHQYPSRFEYIQKNITHPKELKVAICMSGFMRTYKDTANAFVKNVLEPLNADLFIYTPSKVGASRAKSSVSNIVADKDMQSDNVTLQTIYQHYPQDKIKKCTIWNYDQSLFKNKLINGVNTGRVMSFFYHIEKCNELKKQYEEENTFKYDIVIRLRGDLSFLSPINLNSVLKDKNLHQTIYYNAFNHLTSSGRRYIESAFIYPFVNVKNGNMLASGEHYFNDFITVGTSQNMDVACSVYSSFLNHLNDNIGANPETMFLYHIVKNNLNVAMDDIITCQLLRENTPLIINEGLFGDNIEKTLNEVKYKNYIDNLCIYDQH